MVKKTFCDKCKEELGSGVIKSMGVKVREEDFDLCDSCQIKTIEFIRRR